MDIGHILFRGILIIFVIIILIEWWRTKPKTT